MNDDFVRLSYDIDGENFVSAGEASTRVKRSLRQMGFDPEIIRKVSVAMYEGEINMVIHAKGGKATVDVYDDKIVIELADEGPGIPDISLAMQAGFSTAPDNIRSLGFGAGMGLPNMKKYTDEMNIETVVGKGTTVRMTVYV
ncbi:MAG: ATP-binding protein [Clostridia bacterium]|nr:ATP-binding protein [Clostridia bacterium]